MSEAPLSTMITDYTLVDYPRLYKLIEFCKETSTVYGDVAEVGVYKGGTAALLAEYTAENKKLFLFDTFTGLPEVKKGVDLHNKGDFKDTSLIAVDLLLSSYPRSYALYKGVFPKDNAEYIAHRPFSLVHIDVDIYDSVYECLQFFRTRMISGGIIVLDDYNAPTCPGAKLAADDFCRHNPQYGLVIEATVQSQAIIRL